MRVPFRCGLALALLLVAPSLLAAQSYAIDRGSMLIGGTAGFSSTRSESSDDRFSQLNLDPSIHYFVARGLSVGGDLTIRRFWQGDTSSSSYGVGPGVMYFFGGSERPVYPYLSGTARYYRSGDTNTIGYRAAGGALGMLADAVGLNGSLYFEQLDDDVSSRDAFGLAFGIAAFLF